MRERDGLESQNSVKGLCEGDDGLGHTIEGKSVLLDDLGLNDRCSDTNGNIEDKRNR